MNHNRYYYHSLLRLKVNPFSVYFFKLHICTIFMAAETIKSSPDILFPCKFLQILPGGICRCLLSKETQLRQYVRDRCWGFILLFLTRQRHQSQSLPFNPPQLAPLWLMGRQWFHSTVFLTFHIVKERNATDPVPHTRSSKVTDSQIKYSKKKDLALTGRTPWSLDPACGFVSEDWSCSASIHSCLQGMQRCAATRNLFGTPSVCLSEPQTG